MKTNYLQRKSLAKKLQRLIVTKCLDLHEWVYRQEVSLGLRTNYEGFVFDVVNCGPKHRFCSPTLVVSNCLAYLAGDTKFIQKIREGFGPYEAAARATMGWTGGALKKENPQMYLLSKARCVAEGTLVLTEHGYQPIESITKTTKVWDGLAFVSHDGVVLKGEKPVIPVGFEYFTEDHEIFINEESTKFARAICERPDAAQLFRQNSSAGWREVWALGVAIARAYSTRWALVCAMSVRYVREKLRGILGKRVCR
jgi:hypothetical protein